MAPRPEFTPEALAFCPMCGAGLVRQVVLPDSREHPVCPRCEFVYYVHPKLVAGTLPVREGRVLLTRRAIEPSRGLWTFPGGYVDWGEDVRGAALRETREEVGLAVEIEGLHGLYSYPGAPVVIVVFRARVPQELEIRADPHEVMETAYFGPGEIPWEDLAFPSTREALQDWLTGNA